MKTKFLGQAYSSRSPILASQTAINIYSEGTEGNAEAIGAFYGTPGLSTRFTGPVQEVRGMHAATDGLLYAVIGNAVYRIATNFQSTLLGTLPNSTGPVSITDNGLQISFAHRDGMHWVAFTGTTIAPVTNAPLDAITGTMDNYAIFTDTGGSFGITSLADLSTIDPLDIATAEGAPDDLVSVVCDHREAWLFGTETIEIWTDTGASFFPFERSPGGFIEQGCAARRSPAKLDNSVFWIGRDKNGHAVVYRANAYIPVRISTHAMEFAINQYEDISDAIGFSYQEEGHPFYWLIFPRGNACWVYDVATGGWHQRLWLDPNTGLLNRHRANCYAFFNGEHLVGDWQNGKIYALDLETYTDDGGDIYRERAFDLPDSENKRIRMDFIELDCLTGDEQDLEVQGAFQLGAFQPGAFQSQVIGLAPPLIWLQVSRDAGRRFGYQRVRNIGRTGQTFARARWRHCGTGRSIVLKVATTMAKRVHWTGLNMRGEALEQ